MPWPTDKLAARAANSMPDVTADPDQAPRGWDELVRQYGDRIYRLAYRLTGSGDEAEDLTQDVFIRVFRSLHTFRPGTFTGWLHRITTNVFLDSARRKSKIRFDGLADSADDRLRSTVAAPGERLAEAGLDHDVAAALAGLTPEFRVTVVLCDIEGYSYEEIAAALGVKIGTVRSRIHRGRSQLRSALAHRRPVGRHRRYFGVDAEPGNPGVSRFAASLKPA